MSTLLISMVLVLAVLIAIAGGLGIVRHRELRRAHDCLGERVAALSAENARLMNMVEYDDLTAARSRRYLRELFSRSRQDGTNAMIFIDLDEFKSVNDGFGHRAGDAILRRIADALARQCREDETLFRHGGDEFCVYLRNTGMAAAAARAHDFIRAVANTEVTVDGVPVRRTASAGVARIDAGQDMMGALYYADEALYAAKQDGGNTVRVTEGETLKTMIARRTGPRAEDLAAALHREEITYFVQPVFDTVEGHAVGVEALIRWDRGEGDVLLPEKFLDVMRGKYHRDLTPPVRVAADVAQTFGEAGRGVYSAFNISSRFLERSLEDNLRYTDALTHGLDPSLFVFELVENAVIRNPGKTRELFSELRRRGLRIALDDFGTGHSNMERLQSFDIDIVKIDRRFVQGMGGTRADPGILRAIQEMSRDMGFDVIAEGVEREHELHALQDIGIYLVQGYLLGRPERVCYWRERIGTPLPAAYRVRQSA